MLFNPFQFLWHIRKGAAQPKHEDEHAKQVKAKLRLVWIGCLGHGNGG